MAEEVGDRVRPRWPPPWATAPRPTARSGPPCTRWPTPSPPTGSPPTPRHGGRAAASCPSTARSAAGRHRAPGHLRRRPRDGEGDARRPLRRHARHGVVAPMGDDAASPPSDRTRQPRHYLDHASTSPPRPEVVEAMLAVARRRPADPGRIHTEGMAARVASRRRASRWPRCSAPGRARSCSRAGRPRRSPPPVGGGRARRSHGRAGGRALGGPGVRRAHRRRSPWSGSTVTGGSTRPRCSTRSAPTRRSSTCSGPTTRSAPSSRSPRSRGAASGACSCTSTPPRPPATSRSTSTTSAPTCCRSAPTSSAARPASAPCSSAGASACVPCSWAATRSGPAGRATRTCPRSSASAPPPRLGDGRLDAEAADHRALTDAVALPPPSWTA